MQTCSGSKITLWQTTKHVDITQSCPEHLSMKNFLPLNVVLNVNLPTVGTVLIDTEMHSQIIDMKISLISLYIFYVMI